MYSIIWSATAHDVYIHILELLNEQWGIDKAYDFDVKTFKLLASLSSFKNLCPPSKANPKFRKCTINKYTALVYRIDDNQKQIELITFLDNRMKNLF
jgi:plasmid stabilization system protein ParE